MATKKSAATGNLSAMLTAELKKTDNQKALDAVNVTVRRAARNGRNEISTLEDVVDSAQSRLDAAVKSPSSNLMAIVNAQREYDLAVADLEAAAELMAVRFGEEA